MGAIGRSAAAILRSGGAMVDSERIRGFVQNLRLRVGRLVTSLAA